MAINTKPYIYFSVWLLFSLVISACDKAGDRFSKNRIEENERVEFKILNTEFDIPTKYVQGGSRTRANILETASLWTLLPNFEGYDESVNHHDFVEVYHQGRRIKIMLIT